MNDELKALVEELKQDALQATEDFAKKLAAKIPQALEIAAKQSATPIDDVVVAALKQPLQDILMKLADEIKK